MISRYLHEYGYKNVLPQSTHMVAPDEKYRRVPWAKRHERDDFTSTIFTDEALFQLFCNTVRRWTKTPHNKSQCSTKKRQKVHTWDAISVNGIY